MPGAIAPLVAGWDRWRKGFSPPPASPLGGETPGAVKVELFISEQWVDVTRLDRDTPGVYYRDNIVLTRGKADEASTLDRSTCRFTLNNRDGRFSPRNPMSPYYGQLGRNTPVRVSLVQATGIRRYRFHGEISTWPQKWDQSGTDVYTPVEASGILRRLGQGNGSPSSPVYRGLALATDGLVAYWPCEDVTGSTSIASAVSGVSSLVISGTPTLASDSTSFLGSSALPVMATGSFSGTVPSYDSSQSQIVARFLLNVPSGTAASTGPPILTVYTTSAQIARWDVEYVSGAAGIQLYAHDPFGVLVGGTSALVVDDTPVWVSVELDSSGGSADIQARLSTVQAGATSGHTTTATFAAASLGQVSSVAVNRSGGNPSTTFGHLTVQNRITSFYPFGPTVAGNVGEQAGVRLARLCAEDQINYARALPAAATTPTMGRQPVSSLTALIQECVDVDMGRLYEPRDQMGFGYRDRASLYDQTAILALDYAAGQLAAPLDPVDDDQHIRNDITVTRSAGSSVRATSDITGALSVDNVGRYSETTTLNLYLDTQLADSAAWKLHLGTTDEARYPTIQLNLLHPTFTGNDAMMTAAHVLDVGDRVAISNPPSWLPPDQIGLIVEGYTETVGGNDQHTMTLNCSPASPYNVAVYASAVSAGADKYGPSPSTLTAAILSTATTLSVAVDTTTGGGVLWTTDAAEFPFDLAVAGERVTVTAISGTSSPQSFTVTRSVNGIVKAHSAGESVDLFNPRYYDFGAT